MWTKETTMHNHTRTHILLDQQQLRFSCQALSSAGGNCCTIVHISLKLMHTKLWKKNFYKQSLLNQRNTSTNTMHTHKIELDLLICTYSLLICTYSTHEQCHVFLERKQRQPATTSCRTCFHESFLLLWHNKHRWCHFWTFLARHHMEEVVIHGRNKLFLLGASIVTWLWAIN